jgi:hypothetical protein
MKHLKEKKKKWNFKLHSLCHRQRHSRKARKELIRDIVYSLATSITRISIEMERHKLLALAHMSREIAPLLTPYASITQPQPSMQNQATKAINAPTRV